MLGALCDTFMSCPQAGRLLTIEDALPHAELQKRPVLGWRISTQLRSPRRELNSVPVVLLQLPPMPCAGEIAGTTFAETSRFLLQDNRSTDELQGRPFYRPLFAARQKGMSFSRRKKNTGKMGGSGERRAVLLD